MGEPPIFLQYRALKYNKNHPGVQGRRCLAGYGVHL